MRFSKTLFPLLALLVAACSDQTSRVDEVSPTAKPEVTVAVEGFSWIVENELAAMPQPGRSRPLTQDVEYLRQAGVQTIISLSEDPPDAGAMAAGSIHHIRIPVPDFTAPTLQQMIEFVDVVTESAGRGEPVAVHCTAGLGRSGTMAAVYLVANGATADDAIARVRELRPGSIETEAQEEAVRQAEDNYWPGGERR